MAKQKVNHRAVVFLVGKMKNLLKEKILSNMKAKQVYPALLWIYIQMAEKERSEKEFSRMIRKRLGVAPVNQQKKRVVKGK